VRLRLNGPSATAKLRAKPHDRQERDERTAAYRLRRRLGMTYDRRVSPDASVILRKEVIQPQVPLRLPCYDFTPVADPTVVGCLLNG
jgi:hypothetical protein